MQGIITSLTLISAEHIFCMLDKNIINHFKILNDPNLIGWNPKMSIQLILAQLEASYGKQGDQLIWNNDKLF
jgi:hypothetical protein